MTKRANWLASAMAALATAGCLTGAASAATFSFSYAFPTTDTSDFPTGFTSASGLITATPQGGGAFRVTHLSGFWNGETITGIAAINAYGGNDNLIFPGADALVDASGITFHVTGPIAGDQGSGFVNVFSYDFPPTEYDEDDTTSSYSVNLTLTAVPEPQVWAILALGLGLVGAAARGKRTAGGYRSARRRTGMIGAF